MKAAFIYFLTLITGGVIFLIIFHSTGILLQFEDSLLLIFGIFISSSVGGILWYKRIEKKKKYSYKTASIIGFLSVVIGHFGAYYSLLIYQNICYYLTGRCLNALGELPNGLLEGLWISLQFMFFSLIFVVGWISSSLVIFLSMIFLFYRKRAKKFFK